MTSITISYLIRLFLEMERVRRLDRQSISILSGMQVTVIINYIVQQEKLANPNTLINFVKYCRISKAIAAETCKKQAIEEICQCL